jgi:hypothetical protein
MLNLPAFVKIEYQNLPAVKFLIDCRNTTFRVYVPIHEVEQRLAETVSFAGAWDISAVSEIGEFQTVSVVIDGRLNYETTILRVYFDGNVLAIRKEVYTGHVERKTLIFKGNIGCKLAAGHPLNRTWLGFATIA